jgi:hypothetical protein
MNDRLSRKKTAMLSKGEIATGGRHVPDEETRTTALEFLGLKDEYFETDRRVPYPHF